MNMETQTQIPTQQLTESTEVVTYCPICKLRLAHLIEASFKGKIFRVMCKTCKRSHAYREEKKTEKKIHPWHPKYQFAERTKELDEQVKQVIQRNSDKAKDYEMTKTFKIKDLISHSKFGLGLVTKAEEDKITVKFGDDVKVLAHGRLFV